MSTSQSSGRDAMNELRRLADDVCLLILHTDLPEIDIRIQISQVRQRCEELFPDRLELFEMVYGSRFRRLMEQWHSGEPAEEPHWSPGSSSDGEEAELV